MNYLKSLTLLSAAGAMLIGAGCASPLACKDDCSSKIAANDHLKIGWGKRSIASDKPVPITGQFYLRVSQGVFTPVIASALAMEKGKDAAIFVSVDMVSVHFEILKQVKAILAGEMPEIPTDKIIINATHTHAGPSGNEIKMDYPNKVKVTPTSEMRKFLARQIADAVKEAWSKRAPGSVAYGYGFATTGHSRRVAYLDDIGKREQSQAGIAMNGKVKMYGKTNDAMFDGYEAGTDAFINLLYTFDKNGKVTGAIINVPCPAQTSESAWWLHASFWHNVREKLTAKYGDIGVIGQAAAGGDTAPRQMHYRDAEKRRYKLKYADKIAAYLKKPMTYPYAWAKDGEAARRQYEYDVIEVMRAEDIANRIVAAFDEVLSWAKLDKQCSPAFKHEVKTVKLSRRIFPDELVAEEKAKHALVMQEKFKTEGDAIDMLTYNSKLNSRRNRIGGIAKRAELQKTEPKLTTKIHAVKIGDLAFVTNRFELFIDFMHRIQGRSPFAQTVIVQLVTDEYGQGSYLATERAVANKGYSATPYCNQVSPQGGQELVNETLDMLKKMK